MTRAFLITDTLAALKSGPVMVDRSEIDRTKVVHFGKTQEAMVNAALILDKAVPSDRVLSVLAWVVESAQDASTERLEGLEARAALEEMEDLDAVRGWLFDCGLDTTAIMGASPNEALRQQIKAAAAKAERDAQDSHLAALLANEAGVAALVRAFGGASFAAGALGYTFHHVPVVGGEIEGEQAWIIEDRAGARVHGDYPSKDAAARGALSFHLANQEG